MPIQYGSGSIIGRDHRENGVNCQDAYKVVDTPNRFIGLVCDGLSLIDTGEEFVTAISEYGAIFGSNLISQVVYDLSVRLNPPHEAEAVKSRVFWKRVEDDSLAHIRTSALLFGGDINSILTRYFMFTALGVLITPRTSTFFAIGDGNIFVNDEWLGSGPFPDNRPPYLVHRLTGSSQFAPEDLQFRILKSMPTGGLNTFFIGTDGTNDIVENEKHPLPGRQELVGHVSQFWKDEKFFNNPAAIELRLHIMGNDRQQIDWDNKKLLKFPGLLHDDTTLISGRLT